MDWVEAIDYGHEVLHTGVLRYLLREPQVGPQVAGALLGDDALGVEEVRDAITEARIVHGGRRPIDLAAVLDLQDGSHQTLGVEMKVDSAWSPGQLQGTVAPPDLGVLLAVGCTALAATAVEMPVGWRLITPSQWAGIIARLAHPDPDLLSYRAYVEREAHSHEDALECVRECRPVADLRPRTGLEHWAYFHEVAAGRPTDATGWWQRKTLISGPLLTLWLGEQEGFGAYVELMGLANGTRALCVKCWTNRQDLPAIRDRVASCINEPHNRPPRHPPRAAKTCTVWSIRLDGVSPADAAARVEALATRLKTGW